MASSTQWTWVWVDSRSWWWTGRPGVLWFMGSQRFGHDWVTELNWMLQPCLTLWNPLDCSPPGSSLHGIFQARLLEWVAIFSCRVYSWTRIWTCVFCITCIGRPVLYHYHHWGSSIYFNISPKILLDFPDGSEGIAPACSVGDLGLIHQLGTSPWRWKWQPTPVLLPGKFYEWRSLVSHSPCDCRVTHDWATSLLKYYYLDPIVVM